jgi:hypothetical protein
MVSQLVFNPQSVPAKIPYNAQLAQESLQKLIVLLKIAHRECQVKHIYFDKTRFNGLFMDGYSFAEWLNLANSTERTLILSLMLNKATPKMPDWIGLKTKRLAEDYCFDELVWGLAYFFDFVLFSLATHEKWHTELFECEYFDLTKDDDTTKRAVMRHASTAYHLRQHKRIYYCHPKHCHQLPHTGMRGTKMDLTEQDAESVLREAVKVPQKKQLYGYSKKTGSLYEFQPETPQGEKPLMGEQNRYHGYPITIQEMKRDLGGQTFKEVIDALKKRTIIDADIAKELISAMD